MKIFKNKYFILGNIVLLLAAIPLTLLFISRQQDVRSRAAQTTRITFSPATVAFEGDSCSAATTTVRLDPGENIVTTVELFLAYDSTKFDLAIETNESVFPAPDGIVRGPTITDNELSIVLTTGNNVANAIQTPVDIATLTITPVAATTDGAANITVTTDKTRVFSIADSDEELENVFLSGGQVAVSVDEACIGEGPTTEEPNPSITTTVSPSPTGGVGGEDDTTPSPSPATTTSPAPSISQGANIAPVCTTLTASPSASGSAPFALTLTAQGSDSDGTITKATFNFNDGTVQDVTTGLGTAAVTTELSHTYQAAGNYSASVVFTDNSGTISSSCLQGISVSAGTTTPTVTSGIQPTDMPTSTPTIENPGGIGTSIAIVAGLLLVVLGGLALIVF